MDVGEIFSMFFLGVVFSYIILIAVWALYYLWQAENGPFVMTFGVLGGIAAVLFSMGYERLSSKGRF